MDLNATWEQVIELEQYFIDILSPNLNVDLVAGGINGYHKPMSQEIRDKLRKQRGTPVYLYSADDFTLLYIFDSKQHMYDSINIHHSTLNDCLYSGKTYLDTFFFFLDLIEESTNSNLITLDQLKGLVIDKKIFYFILYILLCEN